MPVSRPPITPPWPPDLGSYNYILTLNDEEIAWEALRRDPDYRRDFARSGSGINGRHLPSGQTVWRMPSSPAADYWGLRPFGRSSTDRARGSHPLAYGSGDRGPRCRCKASLSGSAARLRAG